MSNKEFEEALCLCGTYKCEHHYLGYTQQSKYMISLEKEHTKIQRTYCIIRACDK